MGRSQARVVAAVVMVVTMVGICTAPGVHGELEIRNTRNETLTVFYPPLQTCCAHCSPGIPCPQFCTVCTDVVVKPQGCATLNSKAGPYPLEYLKIQIVDKYFCVADNDLKLLTAKALVAVSGVQCSSARSSGVAASVAETSSEKNVCSSSAVTVKNLGVICLEVC